MAHACSRHHPHEATITLINSFANEHEMHCRHAAMQTARRIEEPSMILLWIETAYKAHQRRIVPHTQLGPYCRPSLCIRRMSSSTPGFGVVSSFGP